MSALDMLFGQVANTILNHASPSTPGPSYDANPLLGALSSLFGQHAQQTGGQFGGYQNVRPASEDPQGDPADQGGGLLGGLFGGGNVKPASQDPQGDPADYR